jgi:phage terminase large subunit-like protein
MSDSIDALPEGWDEWTIEQKHSYIETIKYSWTNWARKEQLPPDDIAPDWDIWFLLAGRGFGKTRVGAEFVREQMENMPGCRVGIVGQTIGSARDVCIEGAGSGLLAITPPDLIEKYNRSLGQVHFKNGSRAQTFGGSDPERLRGFQSHFLWMDELCAFDHAEETYDMAIMGLRLGKHPRMVITSTPKPSKLIVELVQRGREEPDKVVLVSGSTFDNAANLPEATIKALKARYEGTRLGRQELYAEILLEDEEALWDRGVLDDTRIDPKDWDAAHMAVRVVIGIDPSMSVTTKRATETGMVVCALGVDGHAYVLEDASMLRPSPDAWARRAVELYHKHSANRIVAEVNQGYDLVSHTVATVDDKVALKKVYAAKAKAPRADPIAALHQQGRIHIVGSMPGLEDQLVSWVPGKPSPDRLDAFVWAMTDLMLGGGMAEVFTAADTKIRLPGIVSRH